jgi:hypothetical protein
VELALLVAALDRLLERGVGALAARVLGREQRSGRIEQDRRVEQDEPLHQLRLPRRELEGEPAAEGVPEPGPRRRTDGREHRVRLRLDAPGRLVGRVAVAQQVRGEHVEPVGQAFPEAGEVPAVARHAVQADEWWSARIAPGVN